MEKTREQIIASLAPPGAGIPPHHLWFNWRVVRPLVANRASWPECRRRFDGFDRALRREVEGLDDVGLTRRVLVPRLMGLEDSSRYWSIAMTVRHLGIVSPKMGRTIVQLSLGESIDEKVEIAKVKPEALTTPGQALADYFDFSRRVLDELEATVGNRGATATHVHPWFGALNARGWFWLMGTHTWIHLRQVREIRRRLGLS